MMKKNGHRGRCLVGGKHPFGAIAPHRIGQGIGISKIGQLECAYESIEVLFGLYRKPAKQNGALGGQLRQQTLSVFSHPGADLTQSVIARGVFVDHEKVTGLRIS